MNCPKCGMRALRDKRGTKSEENTTKIETIDLWICTNPRCDNHKKVSNRTSTTSESVDY